mgnify:FL=1|jgi:hypothetical protein
MNINKIISIMERRGFLRWIPTEMYLKLRYWRLTGHKLDLENPKLYTEKLQALKLKYANSSNLPQYTVMADKIKAKEYVGRVLGEEYIIPTLGIWDCYEKIDFDALPDKFVLKTNHDSGGVVVCSNKAKLDKKKARIKLTKSLKRNFYWYGREPQYRDIKPKIFAEQFMQNSEQGLHDYKVWCFNGKALYTQYITGRMGSETFEAFYDRDWNKQDFTYHNPLMTGNVPRPEKLKELLNCAERLAVGLPFARVDFYVLEDETIKFGEITFFPMSGYQKWEPEEMNLVVGEMLNIDDQIRQENSV